MCGSLLLAGRLRQSKPKGTVIQCYSNIALRFLLQFPELKFEYLGVIGSDIKFSTEAILDTTKLQAMVNEYFNPEVIQIVEGLN